MEQNLAFFSVLIPVYNQRAYLAYCLDSVLAQTMDDYEAIIVDDGSTDGSAALCEAYRRRHPDKLRLLYQEHKGVHAARKRALCAARGKYILFLDSDDAYRQDALEMLRRVIEQRSADVVLFRASVAKDFKTPYAKAPFMEGRVFEGTAKAEVYAVLCGTHLLNPLWLKCMACSLFHAGEDFDSGAGFIGYGEDLYVSIPVLDRAETIVYLDETLYFYRQRAGSATHGYALWQFDSIKAVCARLQKYAKRWQEQYGIDYPRLAEDYCMAECYSTAKNVAGSAMGLLEKRNEIKRLRKDAFFRRFCRGLSGRRALSWPQKLLFMGILCNSRTVLLLVGRGLALKKRILGDERGIWKA